LRVAKSTVTKSSGIFGGVAIAGRMILEAQLFRVGDYSPITELGIVVIFENDLHWKALLKDSSITVQQSS